MNKWNGTWTINYTKEYMYVNTGDTKETYLYDDTPYPDPHKEVFTFWWEDMRAREIVTLIQDAYLAGYNHGIRDTLAKD